MSELETLALCADIPLRLAGLVAYRAALACVSLRTLRSPDKRSDLVRIRQNLALEARQSGFSLWQIGRALNRDHTTIMYSVRVARARMPSPLA